VAQDETEGRGSKYWRDRAARVRKQADDMQTAFAKDLLLDLAALYERLAARAEKRQVNKNDDDGT
jgi:hypothetical protein